MSIEPLGPGNQTYLWAFPNFYNPWDQSAPLTRITEVWPGIGQQCFDVRRYPDGYHGTEHDLWRRCDSFAEAIQLAEEWITRR